MSHSSAKGVRFQPVVIRLHDAVIGHFVGDLLYLLGRHLLLDAVDWKSNFSILVSLLDVVDLILPVILKHLGARDPKQGASEPYFSMASWTLTKSKPRVASGLLIDALLNEGTKKPTCGGASSQSLQLPW